MYPYILDPNAMKHSTLSLFPSRGMKRVLFLSFPLQIFKSLNIRDLLSCAEVCCKWKYIIQTCTLWSQVGTASRDSFRDIFIVISAARFGRGARPPFSSDQLLCGERVAERQHGAAGPEELRPVCDPAQPAWLHLAEPALLSEHL